MRFLRRICGEYQRYSPQQTNSAAPIGDGRQVDEIKRNYFDFL